MKGGVSFIVPAFNCARTLPQTVASIFDGNFVDGDEVLVVDDASDDDTRTVAEALAQRQRAMRIIRHRHNRGGGAARNTAVMNAEHDLIFCLDSDNILAPGSVPRLKAFLLQTAADACSFAELWYFRESPRDVTHKWIFKEGKTDLADYLAGAVVPGASGNYMFTRGSWIKAKGYPESAGALDAWGFGLRQAATGQLMLVMPDSHYFHRYGHESYWVRDTKQSNISLKATQLLIPFFEQLSTDDVDRIMSRAWRDVWFDRLDSHPIRLRDGKRGRSGITTERQAASSRPAAWLNRLKQRILGS